MRKSVRWGAWQGSGQGRRAVIGRSLARHTMDLLGLQTHKGSRPIISLTVRGWDQRTGRKPEV